jgi:hypothetical protein
VPLPTPEPGLVIRYQFLWREEHEAGHESGAKDRPCVVVVAVVATDAGKLTVYVAPVTHRRPADPRDGVEIPWRIKQALGLDREQSWVVTNDLNYFEWPGADLRPIPGSPDRFDYGMLPERFFGLLKQSILQRIERVAATRRS